MNKNLYSSAMDKVTMSDECLGEILDNIDEVQTETITKKSKKVRYIHVIAAVAVFVFGSITVAAESGGFEWVKNFFKGEAEMTENVYDMVSYMANFKCESDYGLKLSPVGSISDPKNLYFILHVDEAPSDIDFDNVSLFIDDYKIDDHGCITTREDYNKDEKNIICKVLSTDDTFRNGEFVKFNVVNTVDETEPVIANLSFTISDRGDYNILNVNYDEYTPSSDYDNIFDKITVSPLSMITYGSKDVIGEGSKYNSEFKIAFKDGTESNYYPTGGHGTTDVTDNRYYYQCEVNFEDEMINPNNISEIYYNDMLIYHREEKDISTIYEMAAEIENFTCESDFKAEFSPVGMLCDEQDLYAIFHIDSLPENLKAEFLNFDVDPTAEYVNKFSGFGSSWTSDFDKENNNVIIKIATPQRVFKEGENIIFDVFYYEYDKETGKEISSLQHVAKMSFTLKLGKYDSLNINYKEYMPDFIPERDYDFLFDEINITPFSMTACGRLYFYADATLSDDFKLILNDGTELYPKSGGWSSAGGRTINESGELYSQTYDSTIIFDYPIDPNSITSIYLGDMMIYHK